MAGQSQAVVDAILGRIEAGSLIPGAAIDGDRLARDVGVSATPLREALIALEAQGLIHRQPRKGAVVFKPTLRQFLAIMEVQARLEGQAAGLAARRLSVERGRRLEAVRDACDAHMATFGDGDPDRYYQRNLDFHGTVAEAAGNDVLFSMVKSNALKLMAYYRARYRFTGVTAASVADHRAIAGAILDRDSPGAEEKMQRHVQFDDVTAMDLLTIFE